MITDEMLMPIGRLFKPHGYKGEMNADIYFDINLFGDRKTPFFIYIDNIPVPFFVESIGGGTSGTSFIKFRGINSDIECIPFVRKELFAEKNFVAVTYGTTPEELEMTADGVKGYEVIRAENGELLGKVEAMEEGVEYDYLIVELKESQAMVHIPFVDEFITEINEKGVSSDGKVFVSLPEGFLESFG